MNKFIENDTEQLQQVIQKLAIAYDNKSANISDELWIKQQLKQEIPYITDEQIDIFINDILSVIKKHDENLNSINAYCDNNGKKEQWLSNKIVEAGSNLSMAEYGEYLSNIDEVIRQNNEAIIDTIFTKSGSINQEDNLHGFIAEQYHANTFNLNAALQGSNLRAEVLKPNGYLHDTYRNRQVLTPLGQKEGISELLPNKSVSDVIDGNKRTSNITSNPLSKYDTKELAYNISKKVVFSSVQAMVITAGLDTTAKVIQGKKAKPSKVMKVAVTTGANIGAKIATATALKIASEKGALSVIPKGVSGFAIGAIASIAVESIKVAYKISTGEISANKGLDLMGRISCSIIGGVIGASEGGSTAVLAGLVLTTNPIVLGIMGITGLITGSIAGNKIGKAVYSGIKTVGKVAKTVVSEIARDVKSIGSSIIKDIKNLF